MPTTRPIQIEGQTLAALELNPGATGEPIILLHGINLSPSFWLTDGVFIEHGPCYALSLPGHYPAAFPRGFQAELLTPELIARVLVGAIRALVGDRPVTLVGISTGGFAALSIAAHDPGLARRLICISGFAQGKWLGPLGFCQRCVQRGRLGRALAKALMQRSLRSFDSYRDEIWPYYVADRAALWAYPQLDALLKNTYSDIKQLDLDQAMLYYPVMFAADISDLLPRIGVATLVMVGDRDPTVPSEQAHLIAARVPGAEFAVLPGAGHLLSVERPTEYSRILHSWLDKTA